MKAVLMASAAVFMLSACEAPEQKNLVSGVDIEALDANVRPQDDFNAYVNGKWMAATEIPADQTSWGSFNVLRENSDINQGAIITEISNKQNLEAGTDAQRVGDFYKSYMDLEKIESLGSAPVLADVEALLATSSIDELVALGASNHVYSTQFPLGLGVFGDLGDSTRYMVYFGQSGLSFPNRDFYTNEGEKFDAMRAALPVYVENLFDLVGVEGAAAKAAAVMDIETKLAAAHWTAAEARDIEKIYNKYTREELSTVSDKINWQQVLDANRVPAEQTEIVVQNPSFATAFGEMLASEPLESWQAYFAYKTLHGAANSLSDDFVQTRFAFNKIVSGQEELPPRWQRATRNLNALMGEAVGSIYVERFFPPAAKLGMDELVQNVLGAFEQSINELSWMGEETKVKAQEKREKFTIKIGYPDKWRDYSALSISSDDLFGNMKNGNEFEHMRNISQLGGPIDRGEWGMTPQTVNAYFNPVLNEIVFPAAILQPPFYNMEAEPAVNYGGIGAVIGHEIGHAFDDNGRKFDGDGNLNDWWTEDDATAFEASAQALVEQYNQFEGLPGLFVNGQLSLGENIGDLTGITISWRAYVNSLHGEEPPVIDGLTGAERFLLGWGQVWQWKAREEALRTRLLQGPHSPPNFRVNGTLMNSPLFMETYGVVEGDGMYRSVEEQVKIW
jgi:predicted metalloendopeptidase